MLFFFICLATVEIAPLALLNEIRNELHSFNMSYTPKKINVPENYISILFGFISELSQSHQKKNKQIDHWENRKMVAH